MAASLPQVPLSVLIPVKNEAANLPRCLASIAWADEIWVVDSQSTDRTSVLAEAAGAKVVQFEFNGIWPKKKNWALEHLPFRHEWVLIIDADETLPPSAAAEIRAIVADPANSTNGYWINRRFQFMGQWLAHAYYPNWNLRLFRHKSGRYERLTNGPTQSGDNEVHEQVQIQGKTGRLKSEMDHYAFPSIAVFIEKHNRYSNWEAVLRLETKTRDGTGPKSNTPSSDDRWFARRRRLKLLAQHLPFRPTLRFLYVYLWQGGIWDGRAGYYFARLHGIYELLSVAKTIELAKAAKAPQRGGK